MDYEAYITVAGSDYRSRRSRSTQAANLVDVNSFFEQITHGPCSWEITAPVLAGKITIEYIPAGAAAMFVLRGIPGCPVYVLALSGYITGLANDDDRQIIDRLRRILSNTPNWEPERGGLNVGPPAYYMVMAPDHVSIPEDSRDRLVESLFGIAEALAIAFFYTIKLDGPTAYRWTDPDEADDDQP